MPKQSGSRVPYVLRHEDKDWVRRRLVERGWTRARLGKEIGMSRQGVYALLGEGGYTYDWPAIVAALGGNPPGGMEPILDGKLKTIVRSWPELSEEARSALVTLAEQSRRRKP